MKWDGSHGGEPSGGKVIARSAGRSLSPEVNVGLKLVITGSMPQSFFRFTLLYALIIRFMVRTMRIR